MNVYINYDKKTNQVLGSYGEEENTPKPYTPISVDDFNAVVKYGMENITVSSDKKRLIVSADIVSAHDAEVNDAQIKTQLSNIDMTSIRAIRSVLAAMKSGKTPDDDDIAKLVEDENKVAELRTKLK